MPTFVVVVDVELSPQSQSTFVIRLEGSCTLPTVADAEQLVAASSVGELQDTVITGGGGAAIVIDVVAAFDRPALALL